MKKSTLLPGQGNGVRSLLDRPEDRSADGTLLGCRATNRDITDPVNTWDDLKAKEEQYRRLVENSMDVIWTLDLDGNFTYLSPSCRRQTGYTPEEYMAVNLRQHLTPESYRLAMETLTIEMNTPIEMRSRSVKLELQHYHKDGSVIDIEVAVSGILDGSGVLTGLQGATRTITDRKRAESALRNSELRFRILSEIAPVGIYETDEKGRCIYVNPSWCKMAGLTWEEAMGDGWQAGIHPEDRQMILKNWRSIVQSDGRQGLEYRFLTKNKITWVYGVAAPIRNAGGEVEGYIGFNMDITERRRTESANQRLLTELKWFTSVVNSSPVVVFYRSMEERAQVDYVSANMIQFGYTADQIMAGDISWHEILHPDDRARLDEEQKQYIEKGIDNFSQEYRLVTARGEVRWIEERSRFIRNSSGQVTHVQGVLMDSTNRKMKEKDKDSERI